MPPQSKRSRIRMSSTSKIFQITSPRSRNNVYRCSDTCEMCNSIQSDGNPSVRCPRLEEYLQYVSHQEHSPDHLYQVHDSGSNSNNSPSDLSSPRSKILKPRGESPGPNCENENDSPGWKISISDTETIPENSFTFGPIMAFGDACEALSRVNFERLAEMLIPTKEDESSNDYTRLDQCALGDDSDFKERLEERLHKAEERRQVALNEVLKLWYENHRSSVELSKQVDELTKKNHELEAIVQELEVRQGEAERRLADIKQNKKRELEEIIEESRMSWKKTKSGD